MTRAVVYHSYKAAGRCVNCSQSSDYGVRCWECARVHHGDPHQLREEKQAEIAQTERDLAETEALIQRLEKEGAVE